MNIIAQINEKKATSNWNTSRCSVFFKALRKQLQYWRQYTETILTWRISHVIRKSEYFKMSEPLIYKQWKKPINMQ